MIWKFGIWWQCCPFLHKNRGEIGQDEKMKTVLWLVWTVLYPLVLLQHNIYDFGIPVKDT